MRVLFLPLKVQTASINMNIPLMILILNLNTHLQCANMMDLCIHAQRMAHYYGLIRQRDIQWLFQHRRN